MIIKKMELSSLEEYNFDLGIFGLGYESRSINCFDKFDTRCKKKIAIGYSYFQNEFDYIINKQLFISRECIIEEMDNDQFDIQIDKLLCTYLIGPPKNVLLDISVMTRHRICEIIWYLKNRLPSDSILIVYYSIAEFKDPPIENYPVKEFGPIAEFLSPLSGRLLQPPVVIAGLGYERDKALGAIGNIDPERVFFLIPTNTEKLYEEKVRENNKILLENYDNRNILTYDVTKPYSSYFELRSLVLGLKNDNRVLLLPLGPKILSVISILIAIEFFPEILVWRVSSEEREVPLNRIASGDTALLRIDL